MIVSHTLMAYQIWRTVFQQLKFCWLGPVGPDDFVGHGGWPWWVDLVGKPPQFMGLGVSELPRSKFHVALFKKLYRTQRHRSATPKFKRISGELCSSTILLWRWGSHDSIYGVESTNLSPKELLGWTTVAVDEFLGGSLESFFWTVGLGPSHRVITLMGIHHIDFGWFWDDLDDFGWFWMILGWFWMILDDFGWFWDDFGMIFSCFTGWLGHLCPGKAALNWKMPWHICSCALGIGRSQC